MIKRRNNYDSNKQKNEKIKRTIIRDWSDLMLREK